MGENVFHTPVLLKEVITGLKIKKGKRYIDATIGGGGHGVEILKKGGIVLGIDIDQEVIDYTSRRWKLEARNWKIPEGNWILIRGNFKDLKEIALLNEFGEVAGILFDLGVSSYQLESEKRGFSFQKDSPLDMRMDPSPSVNGSGQAVTAADLVNGLTREELYELFTKLGEEGHSWAISHRIIRARQIRPITTTKELADLVIGVYRRLGGLKGGIHPATKVFQALRIAVNDELNNLSEALPQAVELLEKEGRLVAISFHSLEDRIVKQFFKQQEQKGMAKILTKKPILPTDGEVRINPRARSAKMRILEKIID